MQRLQYFDFIYEKVVSFRQKKSAAITGDTGAGDGGGIASISYRTPRIAKLIIISNKCAAFKFFIKKNYLCLQLSEARLRLRE